MEEEIMQKLDAIERNSLLASKNILNLDDLCLLTGFKKQRVYQLTSGRKIPHYKQGKSIFFKRSEIEAWFTENRVETMNEANQRALSYVAQN